MTRPHGCHSQPRPKDSLWVQQGWIERDLPFNLKTRLPRMVEIPFTMSKSCHHDLRATDPGCAGCPHNGEAYD